MFYERLSEFAFIEGKFVDVQVGFWPLIYLDIPSLASSLPRSSIKRFDCGWAITKIFQQESQNFLLMWVQPRNREIVRVSIMFKVSGVDILKVCFQIVIYHHLYIWYSRSFGFAFWRSSMNQFEILYQSHSSKNISQSKRYFNKVWWRTFYNISFAASILLSFKINLWKLLLRTVW